MNNERYFQIAGVLAKHRKKHGNGSIPRIRVLRKYIDEFWGDGTPPQTPAMPKRALTNLKFLLEELKKMGIRQRTLLAWATEADRRMEREEYGLLFARTDRKIKENRRAGKPILPKEDRFALTAKGYAAF